MELERVKGTSDLLAAEAAQLRHLQEVLFAVFASYGYQEIATPLLEPTDLYLRKSGSEILSKTYSFVDHGGRRVSLRPEITASVVRAFVEHGGALPFPVRWCYAGPVFRYERPQRGRSRQFTQVGLELIGAAGLAADAEVLAIACEGLERLGLRRYRLLLGHVGIVLQFLESLGLSEWTKSRLVSSMEELSRGRKTLAQLRAQLRDLGVGAATGPQDSTWSSRDLEEERARSMVEQLLEGVNTDLRGSRAPEEIVERLLRKLRSSDNRGSLEEALTFLAQYAQIKGHPQEALRRAMALVQGYGLNPSPLQGLADLVALLGQLGISADRLDLDFGLARGLAYYTGIVFEIYHGGAETKRQLAGGGRYDGLALALGSRQEVPALGFAYGLERLQEALKAEGQALAVPEAAPPEFLVVATELEVFPYALRVAGSLRGQGRRVEMDVRGRSLKANQDYARRRGIASLVMVGTAEAAQGTYRVRWLNTGEEEDVAARFAQ